jgi:hypothetical protein
LPQGTLLDQILGRATKDYKLVFLKPKEINNFQHDNGNQIVGKIMGSLSTLIHKLALLCITNMWQASRKENITH